MMKFSTWDSGMQVVTTPEGEVISNPDRRFPWREKKVKTIRLAKLYMEAGYSDYSRKAAACSTWLKYGLSADGKRDLNAANFCQLRLCPLCIARRAKKMAYKVSKVLDTVAAEHEGIKFLFLTLTIQNVPGDKLGETLGEMMAGWDRLLQHRKIKRTIKGWFRAVEITRGDNRKHMNRKTGKMEFRPDNGYHPHIHAILAVGPEYFSDAGAYLEHSELVARWKLAMRTEYDPHIDIRVARSKGEYRAEKAAAVESAKYAVKDEEYIDDALPEDRLVEIVRDYTEALFKRRLVAFGGWMKEAARALDAENLEEGDLVHLDDETVREDVAELIEIYNWHFGAGDYVLTSRQVNPLKLVQREGSD